tara:strand:+ start:19329 stop:19703 length:375 start_codon:yes stop_codon:yes gene_type:complete
MREKINAETKEPSTPSQVLLGLIVGASLLVPKDLPAKNAEESTNQIKINNESNRYAPFSLNLYSSNIDIQAITKETQFKKSINGKMPDFDSIGFFQVNKNMVFRAQKIPPIIIKIWLLSLVSNK